MRRTRPGIPAWLRRCLLLVVSCPAVAGPNTVLKDFDIAVSQAECRALSIGILQQLATADVPVMELNHVISYTDGDSEVIAVCRADKGLLVVFARGALTEPAHIRFHAAFGANQTMH
jgi:hypothetical protein